MRRFATVLVCLGALLTAASSFAANPFVGDWALTIPGGAAGWLGVQDQGGKVEASMLWGWGSVFPLDSARIQAGKLVMTRKHRVERKNAQGKKEKFTIVETITATTQGNDIHLTSVKPRENGRGEERSEFSGHKEPPMAPAPDLKRVRFGDAIQLFDGKDLNGWRLTDPNAVKGWSVKEGLLVNNPVQEEGKPHKNYGNLRTDREFGDFDLTVQVRVDKDQNSGIYLRGIYEVQVADTYGHGLDPHNMGAVYSRIQPTVSAEKPPGEWQTVHIILVDRHVTVDLNGRRIIDNQPVHGCTGGALWSDVTRPGPIYFQGDHTGIAYRSVVLRPVIQ